MIGDMIAKIRKEKGMTKTELARLTNIDIGHLSHIEKGDRNPSHKALKNICKALNVPYQQLMYTYDKTLSEEQSSYGFIKHISYNKVLAIDNINSFIDCPATIPSASFAIKVPDDSMEPKIAKDSYVFVELNSLVSNNEIGFFKYNNSFIFRTFSNRKDKITLKACNSSYKDITINDNDEFYIIGKIFAK